MSNDSTPIPLLGLESEDEKKVAVFISSEVKSMLAAPLLYTAPETLPLCSGSFFALGTFEQNPQLRAGSRQTALYRFGTYTQDKRNFGLRHLQQ